MNTHTASEALPRKMPNPWFVARASGMTLSEIVRGHAYREAKKNERMIGPYILPPFQRNAVWTREQQIELLESIWDGLPIGSIVFNACQGKKSDGWLLDGQQRVTSLLAYVNNEFPVYGHYWRDLEIHEQRLFRARPISVLETCIASEDDCKKIYDKLAYGGTPHAPEQYS